MLDNYGETLHSSRDASLLCTCVDVPCSSQTTVVEAVRISNGQ